MLRSWSLTSRQGVASFAGSETKARCLSTATSNEGATQSNSNVWQETKNRQGRIYYVNTTTGARIWDHPGQSATVLKIPRVKAPEFKKVSERVYHILVNSTTAYYGLFAVFCAGLTYRIMFPPKPAPPSIGPITEVK